MSKYRRPENHSKSHIVGKHTHARTYVYMSTPTLVNFISSRSTNTVAAYTISTISARKVEGENNSTDENKERTKKASILSRETSYSIPGAVLRFFFGAADR